MKRSEQQTSGSTAQVQEGLNMTPGRRAVNLRWKRDGQLENPATAMELGFPVAVRFNPARRDVQALRQREDAASGLPPREFAELEKGAQENAPQHPDACSARSVSPAFGRSNRQ